MIIWYVPRGHVEIPSVSIASCWWRYFVVVVHQKCVTVLMCSIFSVQIAIRISGSETSVGNFGVCEIIHVLQVAVSLYAGKACDF